MNRTFQQYFRCPEQDVRLVVKGSLSGDSGFFRFGQGIVGYGRYAGSAPADSPQDNLLDAWADSDCAAGFVRLPFDLEEVVENLRLERYTRDSQNGSSAKSVTASLYYAVRPFLPVSFRRRLQRAYLRDWGKIAFPNWPVDHTVDSIMQRSMQLLLRARQLESIPFIWFWPDGASSGASMTHDVETAAGRDFCESLMNFNESFGIPASFQIVPEDRYEVSEKFLDSIRKRGFEVNVQDLNHDGRLSTTEASLQSAREKSTTMAGVLERRVSVLLCCTDGKSGIRTSISPTTCLFPAQVISNLSAAGVARLCPILWVRYSNCQ